MGLAGNGEVAMVLVAGGLVEWLGYSGSKLEWDAPFARSEGAAGEGDSPLGQLATSKSLYNKLDVAIFSARTIRSEGRTGVVDARWDRGGVAHPVGGAGAAKRDVDPHGPEG